MKFDDWLAEFEKNKEEILPPPQNNNVDVHSIRRYQDSNRRFWEFGLTYTGRLVVRSGVVVSDDKVVWEKWLTRHDVDLTSSV